MDQTVDAVVQSLPRAGGTYALLVSIPARVRLIIGALGSVDLPAGLYAYSGSALGPGGIRARLGRHLRGPGKIRWHIDYLRPHTRIEGFCYAVTVDPQPGVSQVRLECRWSQTLANSAGANIPVARFGASDCPRTCRAHLVAFPPGFDPNRIYRLLGGTSSTATTCGKIIPSW